MELKKIFDAYEWKARLLPALITICPIIVIVLAWVPQARSGYSTVISLLTSFGLMHLIARVSRNNGRKKENYLFKLWGGIPTTIMLRHRDNSIDDVTKNRYYKYLENHITDINIPTCEDESIDPDKADIIYTSTIRWLREKTRDTKKYNLVFKENINYGFSRNLYAFKVYGIVINVSTTIVDILLSIFIYNFDFRIIPYEILISGIGYLIFLFVWIKIINEEWVHLSANAYARALLATCEEH